MIQYLSVALTVGATVGLTALGLMPATASPAEGALSSWRASNPAGIVSYDRLASRRPKPTPIPTATGTPTASPSSPAPTATACAYPTSSFNGAAYCPATIVGVRNTAYGTGTRVVLKGVTVTEARPRW